VTNNNLVWRQVQFAPVTTTKIRIHITGFLNGFSRVMEVEAWGVAAIEPASAPAQDREPNFELTEAERHQPVRKSES
jgi:hypothetical protein